MPFDFQLFQTLLLFLLSLQVELAFLVAFFAFALVPFFLFAQHLPATFQFSLSVLIILLPFVFVGHQTVLPKNFAGRRVLIEQLNRRRTFAFDHFAVRPVVGQSDRQRLSRSSDVAAVHGHDELIGRQPTVAIGIGQIPDLMQKRLGQMRLLKKSSRLSSIEKSVAFGNVDERVELLEIFRSNGRRQRQQTGRFDRWKLKRASREKRLRSERNAVRLDRQHIRKQRRRKCGR